LGASCTAAGVKVNVLSKHLLINYTITFLRTLCNFDKLAIAKMGLLTLTFSLDDFFLNLKNERF
jgi:hypothetical protein